MKVILLGYMASGKSTIGKQLAQKIDIPFIDLDIYIEKKEEKSISGIFEEKGEIYFRYQEHFYLKELLSSNASFVLSLGGGTPCYASNMDLISENKGGISIYLQATIKTLVGRLEKEKESRPLVASLSTKKLTEFVAKHLFERNLFYKKATSIVTIDDKEIKDIVDELEVLLR